jgi:hypothetical protein
MNTKPIELIVSDLPVAVCRLGGADPVPGWAVQGAFFSITRTAEELSVVCPENLVPVDVQAERGWRALRVAGVIDFSVIGVLAELTLRLAEARISVFALSTYNTDYLLVKKHDLGRANLAASGSEGVSSSSATERG